MMHTSVVVDTLCAIGHCPMCTKCRTRKWNGHQLMLFIVANGHIRLLLHVAFIFFPNACMHCTIFPNDGQRPTHQTYFAQTYILSLNPVGLLLNQIITNQQHTQKGARVKENEWAKNKLNYQSTSDNNWHVITWICTLVLPFSRRRWLSKPFFQLSLCIWMQNLLSSFFLYVRSLCMIPFICAALQWQVNDGYGRLIDVVQSSTALHVVVVVRILSHKLGTIFFLLLFRSFIYIDRLPNLKKSVPHSVVVRSFLFHI